MIFELQPKCITHSQTSPSGIPKSNPLRLVKYLRSPIGSISHQIEFCGLFFFNACSKKQANVFESMLNYTICLLKSQTSCRVRFSPVFFFFFKTRLLVFVQFVLFSLPNCRFEISTRRKDSCAIVDRLAKIIKKGLRIEPRSPAEDSDSCLVGHQNRRGTSRAQKSSKVTKNRFYFIFFSAFWEG